MDAHGRTKFEASDSIEHALQDIFPHDACQRFAEAAEGDVLIRGRVRLGEPCVLGFDRE